MAIVTVFCCNYCDTGVYARVLNDTRSCECGNVSLVGHDSATGAKDSFRKTEIDVSASYDRMIQDYDDMTDRLGLIRKVTAVEKTLKSGRKAPQPRRYYEEEVTAAIDLIAEE